MFNTVLEVVWLTFEQYINNPMGKNNAVFSGRELFRAKYIDALDKLYVREGGKIDYVLYTKGDNYYIYLKIPSEVVENFYYDVVVEFYPSSGSISNSKSLSDYDVRFFSNDPSFVFTYAYVFSKNDMFIKDLSSKMSKEALKKSPNERNPGYQVGYVKSLYFTYLIMKNKGLFSKLRYDGTDKYNPKALLQMITPADEKIRERQELGSAAKAKRNKRTAGRDVNKREDKNDSKYDNSNQEVRPAVTTTSVISKTSKKSNMVSKIKPGRKSRFLKK